MDRSAEFRRWKAQGLSKADLSRKGSVDEDVVDLVQLLNTQEQFFTTSSCAGRILLLDGAVRSTHGLEVPLSHKGKLMVTEEYIDFLLNIANQKLEENKKRIGRFYNCLQRALERETVTNLHPKIKEKNKPSSSPKKERNTANAQGKCSPEENEKEIEKEGYEELGISGTIFPEDY
uniref:tRNA wybutosine-synthesizing protein 3 homolog n=1 Tax=Cavia porcellus TaxID=10141 RepID=A0A286X9B2_CAVPO